ncbi:ATP-binding protein [Ferrimonas aestuarii]|uniref:histidine kinase n=1 Tax=Ferrimonas aestuarii TaxID=2569539 RepID=A0A4U1BEK4_9GAMM|nr:ATP-binding protein [Ferrimonas aestuarii]TKB49647.1 GHKL domain-containing protein [Ferrimonas aestuarii]
MKRLLRQRPRLQRRLMLTSLVIITLTSLALAEALNQQKAKDLHVTQTNDLLARLPSIAAELRLEGMLPQHILTDTPVPVQDESGYLLITCTNNLRDHYSSSEAAKRLGLQDSCERVRQLGQQNNGPDVVSLADGKSYSVVVVPLTINQQEFEILVLSDAEDVQQQLATSYRQTYVRVGLFIPLSGLLLVGASFWGLRPLRQLSDEVRNIIKGKSSKVSEDYPVELSNVASALNELLSKEKHQRQTYQDAMKDLAHSLKTRLAATNAIMDEPGIEQKERNQQMLAQLNQMDQIIQYQLRRAMVGRQGLTREHTPIHEVTDKLTTMLSKVYMEKRINAQLNIPEEVMFPGNRDDLMEMLGNLLENAYRFAISTVVVHASLNEHDGLTLIVEDDGPGIEPELRQAVLQRGVRADRRNPGQGIGLAVVNDIVSSYQGDIEITDSELEGAKIKISFKSA